MNETAVKAYLASIGSKGGKSGTGDSKRRGGRDYYKRISKLAAAARNARRKAAKTGTNVRRTA